MRIENYTEHYSVVHAINRLRAFWDEQGKPAVSDLYEGTASNRERQYVDLVMEGGGVLGIALVGYAYALEQVGIRFVSIGGTSAGSINALLMAGLAEPHEPRAIKVLGALAPLNMMDFIDGGDDAEDLVKDLGKKSLFGRARLTRSIVRNLDEVFLGPIGMSPGRRFRDWLAEHLGAEGIFSTRQLIDRMNAFPDALKPARLAPEATLKVVATDVTLQRKAVFPEEADLYFSDPDSVDPALFVRASMSVPYLFEPVRVPIQRRSPEALERWLSKANYPGRLPGEVMLVDGGVLSNFPISLFHAPPGRAPTRPTFGVKLGTPAREPVDIGGPLELAFSMFGAARRDSDAAFLDANPDYRHLVGYIDTEDISWLDFSMREETRIRLFALGVEAACAFLTSFCRFGWGRYKELRAALADRTLNDE